nr:MAG: ORF1 [TTV-like mini virus]
MPPFTYRWRRPWRRPQRYRYRFRRRRIRPTLRRRYWRRRWVRRRRKKYFKKRKLSKITLKQWNPKKIVKCTIKGNLCLIACGRQRQNFNYTLYSESIVPVKEPGGGGWSVMQLTLRALYDEFIHYRNYWTKGNQGLPLVKYLGCEFKFYRSLQTDYLVVINVCPPFEVTLDSYLNTQPSRQLMYYKTIVVPQLTKQYKRKPYIKKRIQPPSLFLNKWYFQQDLYNIPFIMLTTVACSLDQMYMPMDQISYNLTLYSLNIELFENPQWGNLGTSGYHAKISSGKTIYIYTARNGDENPKWKDIIPLFQTKRWAKGKPLNSSPSTNISNETYWGNPFIQEYAHPDVRYFYGQLPTTGNNADSPSNLGLVHEMYFQCRYNPFKDKGTGNVFYFKSTSLDQGTFFTLPQNNQLILRDYPIWLAMWAWVEWIKKSKPIQHIEEDYQLVIQSPYIEPKRRAYLFLDKYFTNSDTTKLTESDKANWHPKYEMQTEATNSLAVSGPATPKINTTKSIECHCNYRFFLKWGGCPAPMENVTNPADQEKFPTPNTIYQGLKIQDPNTSKKHYLYNWDERHETITKRAAKRIKRDSISSTSFTDYGPKELPIKTSSETTDETSTEEETETPLSEQLVKLKLKQHQLRHRLKQLRKSTKYFP